jgi:hypothetical protein
MSHFSSFANCDRKSAAKNEAGNVLYIYKGKGKGHPITGHEGQEVE